MQDTSEKAKRKGTPLNLRRYWLIFGLIVILLIIPFRIVPYWTAMAYTYVAISVLIGLAILRFIWRYSFRHWVLILMLICMLLPIGQIMLINSETINGNCYTEQQGIRTIISCSTVSSSCPYGKGSTYVALQGLPVSILTASYRGSLFMYCLF